MQEQTDPQTESQTPAEAGAHHLAQAWDRGPAEQIMLHTNGWEKQSWEELHNSESKEEINMPALHQEMECVR